MFSGRQKKELCWMHASGDCTISCVKIRSEAWNTIVLIIYLTSSSFDGISPVCSAIWGDLAWTPV